MADILIIEDDVKFREVLKEMLERQNYEVIVASDGEEGIRKYRSNPTPVVITDLIMPTKEGMETIFAFLKDFPEAKIIAISGGGRVGGNDYLKTAGRIPNVKYTFQKPFAMNDLLQAVKEILG